MESILTSIKKLLGIAEDYTHFDDDVIIHINTVLMDLTGLHVGPSSGFVITDKTAVWTDFVRDPLKLASIKSYMYLRVKLLFDPPTNASLLNSMQQQIEKFEWLINVAAENDRSGIVDDNVSEEIKALIAELERENETLKSLNATLQQSVDTLTETNSSLEVDNADLRTANESLQTRNYDLEFQNGELSIRNETLLTENESLESANETLSTKNAELESENERLEASIKPEQRKTVEITENGTTEILPDEGNTLSGVDLTVNVPSSGGTEEIENIIDQSGVLDSTDGTATEKVEQLIDKAEEQKMLSKAFSVGTGFDRNTLSFNNNEYQFVTIPTLDWSKKTPLVYALANPYIEYIDYYINSSSSSNFGSCLYNTKSLTRMVGIDTSNATSIYEIYNLSAIETIQEPFDLSKVTNTRNAFNCANLKEIRFVAETIKVSIAFTSSVLSDESIQSIIDGLNKSVEGQVLTLHSDVLSRLTNDQWNTIGETTWNIE